MSIVQIVNVTRIYNVCELAARFWQPVNLYTTFQGELMNRKYLSLIALTVILTLTAGCSSAAGSQVGTAKDGNEVKIETAAIKLVNAVNKGGYELVNTDELNKWIEAGEDMILIDTMPGDFYGKGHIPTALNAVMPKSSLADATDAEKEAFAALLGEDKEKKIVVYCGFTACGRSDAGAAYAKELGFTNVYRYPGGIIGWRDAELAEEK